MDGWDGMGYTNIFLFRELPAIIIHFLRCFARIVAKAGTGHSRGHNLVFCQGCLQECDLVGLD